MIRAVVSDWGGVLTAPLLEGFERIQDDIGVPPRALGAAISSAAAADGRNPLFALEVGAISEAEFLATLERELAPALGRPVTLHGFGERYMAALDPNDALFAHYRALHGRGVRFALLTNNVREWQPLWRTRLPLDEVFELVVDSALRRPAQARSGDLRAGARAARAAGGGLRVRGRLRGQHRGRRGARLRHRPLPRHRAGDRRARPAGGRMSLAYRPERPADHDAIRRVHAAAFAPSEVEAPLVDALRAAGDLVVPLSLVAEDDTGVVGHVAISRATAGGADVLALGPLGVLPERQGEGIGSALTRAALAAAAATDYPLVALLGHADYYPRFGFEPAGALGLRCPYPVAPESWLALRLPADDGTARGDFRYAAAFPAEA